jgi:hypothetical protein
MMELAQRVTAVTVKLNITDSSLLRCTYLLCGEAGQQPGLGNNRQGVSRQVRDPQTQRGRRIRDGPAVTNKKGHTVIFWIGLYALPVRGRGTQGLCDEQPCLLSRIPNGFNPRGLLIKLPVVADDMRSLRIPKARRNLSTVSAGSKVRGKR